MRIQIHNRPTASQGCDNALDLFGKLLSLLHSLSLAVDANDRLAPKLLSAIVEPFKDFPAEIKFVIQDHANRTHCAGDITQTEIIHILRLTTKLSIIFLYLYSVYSAWKLGTNVSTATQSTISMIQRAENNFNMVLSIITNSLTAISSYLLSDLAITFVVDIFT